MPQYHRSRAFSVVPVLPATGWSTFRAWLMTLAVPPACVTPFITSMAASATAVENTCFGLSLCLYTTLPLRSSILVMATESRW